MAEVDLPPAGWQYAYATVEPPRRGREVFRPIVPVRLSLQQPSALFALVDSGSEHTLAPRWLADELGIDLDETNDRLLLGVGGRTHTSLPIEAMVVDTQGRGAVLPLGDEYRVLYRLCAEPQAVAELSARAAMPLGVVRVLVGDLVATGALVMAEPGLGGDDELDFIDSIILAIEHM